MAKPIFVDWENLHLNSQEEQDNNLSGSKQGANTIPEENELKRLTQLRKLQYHKDNNEHSDYRTTMTRFGELLIINKREEIARTLLTEDCEVFLFNFAERSRAQFAFKHEGFVSILNGYQITQRDVKESYIDSKKETGFQICYCLLRNEQDSSITEQFSFESFSFKNSKIHKYRASFGYLSPLSEAQGLFTPSRKEQMLTKVKELNYAFADQPDFEKIALILHENTEYKIWRWKDKKLFTFNKHNIASDFRKSLEEDFVIKSIVPFDPSIEAQYVFGSYVYYLEGKGELSGKRYHWISTCIFTFDRDMNISKISQQGELYKEDEILIPFEVQSEEKIKEKLEDIYLVGKDTNLSILNSDEINFSFDLGLFSTSTSPISGLVKGLSEYNKLTEILKGKNGDFEQTKPVDIYLGCDDPCYDTAIAIDCTKGVLHNKDSLLYGKTINVYGIRKCSFENGRLAKIILFAFAIPEPIPSPYDNSNFTELNIRPKHEFFKS